MPSPQNIAAPETEPGDPSLHLHSFAAYIFDRSIEFPISLSLFYPLFSKIIILNTNLAKTAH